MTQTPTPAEQITTEQTPTEQTSTEQTPAAEQTQPVGETSTTQTLEEQIPTKKASPAGQTQSPGQESAGETPTGDAPAGKTPTGQASTGYSSATHSASEAPHPPNNIIPTGASLTGQLPATSIANLASIIASIGGIANPTPANPTHEPTFLTYTKSNGSTAASTSPVQASVAPLFGFLKKYIYTFMFAALFVIV